MTRKTALEYIRGCSEDEGPADEAEAREIYRALYDSEAEPDADQLAIWSECCAYPDVDDEVSR